MRTGAKLNRATLPSTCSITTACWQVHNRHHNAGKQEQGDHARDQNWKQMKGCTPAPTKAGRAPPTRRNYRQKSSGRSARPPEKSRYDRKLHGTSAGRRLSAGKNTPTTPTGWRSPVAKATECSHSGRVDCLKVAQASVNAGRHALASVVAANIGYAAPLNPPSR